MLIVTAAVSVAAFFWTDLWIGLALIKFNGGSDILSAEPWRLLTVALVHGSPLEAGIGAIQGTAVHLFFNLFALDLGARLRLADPPSERLCPGGADGTATLPR